MSSSLAEGGSLLDNTQCVNFYLLQFRQIYLADNQMIVKFSMFHPIDEYKVLIIT